MTLGQFRHATEAFPDEVEMSIRIDEGGETVKQDAAYSISGYMVDYADYPDKVKSITLNHISRDIRKK